MSGWMLIEAERLLVVDRGRDVILSDHTARTLGPNGGSLLLKLSAQSIERLGYELPAVIASIKDVGSAEIQTTKPESKQNI